MEVRILNVLLGIWLFVSAFVWEHATAQRVNSLVLGVVCTVAAVLALRLRPARWVNMALAAWLFLSVIVLPRSGSFGMWNNLLVAVCMFIVAGVPGYDELVRERRAPA